MAPSRFARRLLSSAARRRRGAAATPSPDPALAAVNELLKKGKVTVRVGMVEYRLTVREYAPSYRPITVDYRLCPAPGMPFGPFRELNPGWSVPPEAILHTFNPVKSRNKVQVAGLTVLNAIYSGLPVYRLKCGTRMSPDNYH